MKDEDFEEDENQCTEAAESTADLVVVGSRVFHLFEDALSDSMFDMICTQVCRFLNPKSASGFNHGESTLLSLCCVNRRINQRMILNGLIWQHALSMLYMPYLVLTLPIRPSMYAFFKLSHRSSSISPESPDGFEDVDFNLAAFMLETIDLKLRLTRVWVFDWFSRALHCSCGMKFKKADQAGSLLGALVDHDEDKISLRIDGKKFAAWRYGLYEYNLKCSNSKCSFNFHLTLSSSGIVSCKCCSFGTLPPDIAIDSLMLCECCDRVVCDSDTAMCMLCGVPSCQNCLTSCNICLTPSCKECIFTCKKRCKRSLCVDCASFCQNCWCQVCSCETLETCKYCGDQCCESCVEDACDRCGDCEECFCDEEGFSCQPCQPERIYCSNDNCLADLCKICDKITETEWDCTYFCRDCCR